MQALLFFAGCLIRWEDIPNYWKWFGYIDVLRCAQACAWGRQRQLRGWCGLAQATRTQPLGGPQHPPNQTKPNQTPTSPSLAAACRYAYGALMRNQFAGERNVVFVNNTTVLDYCEWRSCWAGSMCCSLRP